MTDAALAEEEEAAGSFVLLGLPAVFQRSASDSLGPALGCLRPAADEFGGSRRPTTTGSTQQQPWIALPSSSSAAKPLARGHFNIAAGSRFHYTTHPTRTPGRKLPSWEGGGV